MAGAHPAVWFGFGFCGFGQVPGSGSGRQVLRPERLLDADICRVSAGWSYTAVLTRAGRLQLSGSADGGAGGCTDVWASEDLLVLLRSRPGPGPRIELQAWEPAAALRGDPRWTRLLEDDSESDDGGGGDGQPGPLPLLPGARAYVSPRPPHYRPLGPELRARRLELGAEHALLLDATGQVFSWGAGRHGQLGHGTLEPAPEPRLLEALQGLSMAAVAAGGWHSVCVSESGDLYVWGWNESGQLGLPARGLGEPQVAEAPSPGGSAAAEDRTEADTAPYIAVQPFPALLDLPSGSDVIAASCGSRHTAAVTRTGELYSWGWGKYGQLGHANTTSLDRPCRVRYFKEQRLRVLSVSCGAWSTFVCAEEEPRAAP